MKYKPYYSKQMSNLLVDSNFVKEHGKLLLSILESNYFWQKLKQRVDFLFYA